jgi:hypothetical protein
MSTQLQGANALTFAANSGALAGGSTASQFTNGATINYAINGRFFSRATIASQPLVIEPNTGIVPTAPQTLQSIPAGRACAFAVILDTAGAFTVMQGDIVEAGLNTPVPMAPATKLIVGAIKVNNASGSAFVPGTTAFNVGGGVTTTYVNLAQHPGTSI